MINHNKTNNLLVTSESELYSPINLSSVQANYDGKILLREEILLNDELLNSLKLKGYFTTLDAIHRTFLFNKCRRCNNRKKHLFAEIECSRCNTSHLYCRNCLMMGRVLQCEPLYYWTGPKITWQRHSILFDSLSTLTPLQKKTANQAIMTIKEQKELLIWAVAGAGKTEMIFPAIAYCLSSGLRLCIATPRTDVVLELLPRLKKAFPMITIQALYSKSTDKNLNEQLIITTTHQLLRYYETFDVIIVDEVDAFPYHHDDTLQFAVKRARKRRSAAIYLTATPKEKQMQLIAKKKIYVSYVPLRYHGHLLPVPTLKPILTLNKNIQNHLLPKQLINWLRMRKRNDRQLLIFVPTIQMAESLGILLLDYLLEHQLILDEAEIEHVHAADELRYEKVLAFRNNEINYIITTTILERGVTFPSVDVAILMADHDVFDAAALIQIAGRAGRSSDDPTGEVVFFYEHLTDALVKARETINHLNYRAKRLLRGVEQ